MNRIQIKTLNSMIFLFVIFSVGFVSVAGISFPGTGLHRFLNGTTFRTIEDNYQESFPEKNWVVGIWAALQYKLFKEGRPGVVIGRNNWLFSAEEFHFSKDSMKTWQENIAQINQVNQSLKALHKTLVVVLVPEKVDIYSNYLDRPSQHNTSNLYTKALQQIQRDAIPVIEVKSTLRTLKEKGTQVFLRTDTHWTVAGAQAAAQKIAESGMIAKGSVHFSWHNSGKILHTGDLLNYIPTGKTFAKFAPPPETLQQVDFKKEGGTEDLFADVALHTVLVGTSYSADERWHFQDWLQYYLQQEIVNYSEKGHGPFTPMKKFLAMEKKQASDVNCIIWEIPIRSLLMNPEHDETKQ